MPKLPRSSRQIGPGGGGRHDQFFAAASALVERSGLFDAAWYAARTPELARSGLSAVEHYLRHGAAENRDPGPAFDLAWYRTTYPEADLPGTDPLLFHLTTGVERGYRAAPEPVDPRLAALRGVEELRIKLLMLGLADRSLAELRRVAADSPYPDARTAAGWELAVWHLRSPDPGAPRLALSALSQVRADAPSLEWRGKLATAELLAHWRLDNLDGGMAAYERAALAGEMTPNTMLAWANFHAAPEAKLPWINQVLAHYGIAPVRLLPDETLEPYDRLAPASGLPAVTDGPKVSVLMAAYDAASSIPTAVRSLTEQTWRNLEIVIVDDCSADDTCAVVDRLAARDPRIRLLRMERNGGAYVARNRGLDAATGDVVTLHDADDWSHPQKIETQMRFMADNPDVMGCTSDQARCRSDLDFATIRGNGGFLTFNTSSFLWRRAPVRDRLGYWDTVRFGADSEFIRRMQKAFGKTSYRKVPTGPLSFQREAGSSVTSDRAKGIGNGFYYGVRREYFDAQRHHHAAAADLRYDGAPDSRPFPVPQMMRARRPDGPIRCDVAICADLRRPGPEVDRAMAEIDRAAADGLTVGLVERPRFDAAIARAHHPDAHSICAAVRARVDGDRVRVLVYGDEVVAGRVLTLYEDDRDAGLGPRLGAGPSD